MTLRVGLLVLAFWAAVPAHGADARSWSASSADEFARGTLEGTAVDGEGRIRLAPPGTTVWGPEPGIVWDVAFDERAGTFVALSGPGRVLRLDRRAEPETWYEASDERLVTALVPDGQGGVYFGVSPEGRVLRVRDGGTVETIVETGAAFVWALAREADGRLWVGTGVPGRLLERSPRGSVKAVYEAGDDPVRSLAVLPGGGVVVGTGGRGRVLRVEGEQRRPFVVFDADEAEIVSLAVGADGTIWALAAAGSKQVARPRPTAAAAGSGLQETVRVVATPPPGEDAPPAEERAPERAPRQAEQPPRLKATPGGALYRIAREGSSRRVWSTEREMPFAVALVPDAGVLVATGDEGRIVALDEQGRPWQLMRVASNQASAMFVAPDGRVYVGGTNDARVEVLGPGVRREGSYLGPAVDAGTLADWGRVHWEADLPPGTRIRLEARSGNTAEADDTWSSWTPLEGTPEAGYAGALQPARWCQVRVAMTGRRGATPALRRLELFFAPRNRAPIVESLSVEAPGVVWVRGPVQSGARVGPVVADDPVARQASEGLRPRGVRPGAIRRGYEAGARTFSWSARDPDGDRLRYDVELRREGTTQWFPLVRDLEEAYVSWDARGLPDGLYRARLTALDASDNPDGTHLLDRRESPVFRVDNTRPRVEELEVRSTGERYRVGFVASDPAGSIAAAEVATDGGEWQPLHPVDGVADSPEEHYRLFVDAVDGAGASLRAVRVRVTDSSGNLGGDVWVVEQP